MSRLIRIAGAAGVLAISLLAGGNAAQAAPAPCAVSAPSAGTVQVDDCAGAECVRADGGAEEGSISLRLYGPGPGSCVLLCVWRFDPMSGWWLDCPWAPF